MKPFFRDDLPESAYKFQLLGLNLLRLLAQNKLADFHTVGQQCTNISSRLMLVQIAVHSNVTFALKGVGVVARQRTSPQRLHPTSRLDRTILDGRQLQQGNYLLSIMVRVSKNHKQPRIAGIPGSRQCSRWELQFLHWHPLKHDTVGLLFSKRHFQFWPIALM